MVKGVLPEALTRIHAPMAKAFILLCLGRRVNTGDEACDEIMRPTATELLCHPFLRANEEMDDKFAGVTGMQTSLVCIYSHLIFGGIQR